MSFLGFLRVTVAVAILVLLHFTLRPLLGWRAPIDFLVIAALLAAVRLRPGMAALLGFVLGLAADALTPSAFGCGALALSAVAFAASWLKAVFFADNLALSALFFFAGKWTFDALYLVAERRVRGTELVDAAAAVVAARRDGHRRRRDPAAAGAAAGPGTSSA